MECEQWEGDLATAWTDGQWFEAVVCPFDLGMGATTFGLIIYSGIMMSLYVRTQSLVIPMTVTVLMGTLAVSRLPSRAMQILGLGLLLGATAATYLVYRRVQNVT